MKKITYLLAILFCAAQVSYAQSPTLVEDYILGPQGSINNRIFEFQNTLTYLGLNQNGERTILQYEKESDEISILATKEDFDGDLISIISNTEEMIVLTGEGSMIYNIYKSFESNFSDISKVYDSSQVPIRRFRFYFGHTLLFEENFDGVDYTTNIKVIFPDESTETLYTDLPGRNFDYQYTAAENHFIIAPEETLIDGNSIIAYNLENRSIVPFTDIVPTFQECGLISRLVSFNESIIYWVCDANYTYDLTLDQFVEFNDGSFLPYYDNGDFSYVIFNSGLYKVNRVSGEQELLLDQIVTSRGLSSRFCCLTENGDVVDLHYIDFEEGILYSYPTNYPSDVSYRFSGFGIVPSGVHLIIYESFADGVIVNINSNSYTEIDSVFNITSSMRPVAYGEDIYFTHEDPEFGKELFIIDYDIVSTLDHNTISSIKISPNPAQDFIIIKHANDLIPRSTSIFDINGSTVLNQVNGNKIDITSLSSGIYTLRTSYLDGKLGIERFVVK